ncbi:three-helix bundle dimerization domain-containing protein [Microbacterium sp. RU33B]|uniref:three-helix bundle dimerization domain-containing protein n=1 Tax=Microbacterium sp. RU33B TaxID=1907390 RepID=UPI000963DE5C|nr:hypothetical protein [Microbacterium sp. RU33B]SIT83452.1 hypothetical protein SAMN05880545_2050 [Microbacterium sp. RU33B]
MPEDRSIDEDRAVAEIAERLQERFPDKPAAEIVAAIDEARASFDGAKVRDFVPVLIEKEAKAHLKGKR